MKPDLNKYKKWLGFLARVEESFIHEGFLKVRTPNLVPSPAMESCLDAFRINEESYLPTSPEFSLKKLWYSGLSEKIFEISSSYRDESVGVKHLKEFTMLEFYSKGESFEGLKKISQKFFSEFLDINPIELKLDQVFFTLTGFEIKPDTQIKDLKKVLDFHQIKYFNSGSWADYYHLIYLNLIEPYFAKESLIFLTNFPPQLSALAKINSQGWAARLEIFYKGVELGNGYDELSDVEEILERWETENINRLNEKKMPHPIDHKLLKIIKNSDFKNGVGMAIGMERLFSILNDYEDIKVWPNFRGQND